MTSPSAKKTTEQEDAQKNERHQYAADSDRTLLERVHRFVQFHRRKRSLGHHPVCDVYCDDEMNSDENNRTDSTVF